MARPWKCLSCRVALGYIVAETRTPTGVYDGRLSIDRATARVEKDALGREHGATVTCRYCGKSKRWYGMIVESKATSEQHQTTSAGA